MVALTDGFVTYMRTAVRQLLAWGRHAASDASVDRRANFMHVEYESGQGKLRAVWKYPRRHSRLGSIGFGATAASKVGPVAGAAGRDRAGGRRERAEWGRRGRPRAAEGGALMLREANSAGRRRLGEALLAEAVGEIALSGAVGRRGPHRPRLARK
jgi:hypothetical protein